MKPMKVASLVSTSSSPCKNVLTIFAMMPSEPAPTMVFSNPTR
jgi:hypothetical protein